MTEEKTQLIHKKILAVMSEIEAIGKTRDNVQQRYKFRGIDDVYNEVQPLMVKHGLYMRAEILSDRSEERAAKSGGALIYRIINMRYYFIAEDGSFITTDAIGEGMDSGDKAGPKAMSIAQKYAVLQVFMIPTEDPKDSENDSPDPKPKPKAATRPAATRAFVRMTKAQSNLIHDLVSQYRELTKADISSVAADIMKKIEIFHGKGVASSNDFTSEMADTAIKALQTWIEEETAKKIEGAE
jgi:hypothetical protein